MKDEELQAIARHIMIKISNDLGWTLIPPKYEEWVLSGLREVADGSTASIGKARRCVICGYINKGTFCTHCGSGISL